MSRCLHLALLNRQHVPMLFDLARSRLALLKAKFTCSKFLIAPTVTNCLAPDASIFSKSRIPPLEKSRESMGSSILETPPHCARHPSFFSPDSAPRLHTCALTGRGGPHCPVSFPASSVGGAAVQSNCLACSLPGPRGIQHYLCLLQALGYIPIGHVKTANFRSQMRF